MLRVHYYRSIYNFGDTLMENWERKSFKIHMYLILLGKTPQVISLENVLDRNREFNSQCPNSSPLCTLIVSHLTPGISNVVSLWVPQLLFLCSFLSQLIAPAVVATYIEIVEVCILSYTITMP
jgi:hypothetical protein